MPSLFSRTRTQSTPHKGPFPLHDGNSPASLDEFGRVSSRTSTRAFPGVISVSTPSKKDKKKAKELAKRSKTAVPKGEIPDLDNDLSPTVPDGTFLPLNLEPPRTDSPVGEQSRENDYGYLSYERHVILGLEQLEALVKVVTEELETRGGITTPFIFSTTALDISASAIKRLIRSFLNVYSVHGAYDFATAENAWREEARFAGPHELGMCLRWGLARAIRTVGGQDVRGLISWDHYLRFRDSEAKLDYPPGHFESFFLDLEPTLQNILRQVLGLLTRLTANSTSSGHTPPTLSPLFGPLLFGLGPATLAFHHAYIHYLRAVNATEHILLAFIRWQDTPRLAASTDSDAMYPSGSASSLGVPIRLKEWIKGYPAMLPFLREQKKMAKPQPRKGAKTVTVTSVRRNVRMYSPDLVKTAAQWANRTRSSNGIINGLASAKEWERIAPPTLKLPPRYSEAYRKRMNMAPNFHPETSLGLPSSSSTSSTASSFAPTLASTLTIGTVSPSSDKDYFGLSRKEGEDRFRSLTDLKWGEFESMGFGGLGDEKKLQFDLTESAREERSAKRQTMSWNDFSAAGFSRTDAPLSTTLQFSTPLTLSLSSWPSRDAELSKKIKKTEKQLPPFGWDTGPIMGNEEVIEEAFVDVFCDLIYGGGWMDLERGEGLDRDCNWALVEFKSLPPSRTTVTGGSDPRTSSTLILFEEFVPSEYRDQLAVKSTTRRRLPAFLSPSKKQWKQAATLNGRPYIVGHVPRSPSYREMEFEGLLQGGSATKVISLGSKASTRVVSSIAPTSVSPTFSSPPPVPPLPMVSSQPLVPPKSDDPHSDSTMSPSVKKATSRFKLPAIPVPSPNRRSMIPAEYSAVEFETRLASYSDSERNDEFEPGSTKKKRQPSDDAWVDILVNSQSRRMAGQDVEVKKKSTKGDPDLASLEVAQVLAAVRERSPSQASLSDRDDFVPDRVDRDYGMDAHVDELEIDEIETVPRTSHGDRRSLHSEGSDQGRLAYDHDEEYAADAEGADEPEGEPAAGAGTEADTSARDVIKQQRRLGYFDLHPERKQLYTGEPQQQFPITEPTSTTLPLLPQNRDAASIPHSPLPDLPRPGQLSEHGQTEQGKTSPARVDPVTPPRSTSQHSGNGHAVAPANGNSPPGAPAPATGAGSSHPMGPRAPASGTKTAALIEMYRERERRTGSAPSTNVPSATPPLSVLVPQPTIPVRSSSLPKDTPLPKPVVPEEPYADPPRVVLDESGRASPARYVHGAPLHNVLEEPEEE